MKIGFDVSVLQTPNPTGVEKSFSSLIQALKRNGIECLSFSPEKGQRSRWWRQTSFRKSLREKKVDVLHSPVSAFPLLAPCKKIVTVHEIPWLEENMQGDGGCRWNHRTWTFLAAQYADRVICPSQYTANRLSVLYPAAREKIRVVTHGVDEKFRIEANGNIRKKYQIPAEPFFLCVGGNRPKKNIETAKKAFEIFQKSSNQKFQLICTHEIGNGYVPEEDLPNLYRSAIAVLYLSYSEGFGLPPLEAMACGTAVIASNRGAIPEISGPGVILVSPNQPELVATTMQLLVENSEFRNAQIERGRKHAAQFRWEESARKMLAIYQELCP